MKTYTARVIEQQGSSSRTGTFLLDVEDSVGDAGAIAIAGGHLYTEDLDIEWGSWEDDSQATVYVAGVTLLQSPPKITPRWATRGGALRDIDSLYGWSNPHYGRLSQASDEEVVAIAADQRMWEEQNGLRNAAYPHKELS